MTMANLSIDGWAAAHVDYQVKVKPLGDFPGELTSLFLTQPFPLSPSPNVQETEGIKIFTYQHKYVCFCYFFPGGKRDERGRETSSARVLLIPLISGQSVLPRLRSIGEWLKENNLDALTTDQFSEKANALAQTTFNPVAQTTPWFPYLLAEFIRRRHVTMLGASTQELWTWLDLLWHYTPDFLRYSTDWSTYTWSERMEHEAVITKVGQLQPPAKPSFLDKLFKGSQTNDDPFAFDVSQGIANYSLEQPILKPWQWLCAELIDNQPWSDWSEKQQREFLISTLKKLSETPKIKGKELLTGYPPNPKLTEFLACFK